MAKIKEEDIDHLRERADIVEVVSGYSQLKKAGGRTFKGLCPFHSEKTPSFTVDAAKGLWHCFGCGEGGNIYHFVQKVENLPFPEAVEWLARKEGFNLHYEEMRPGERAAQGLKARIMEANSIAADFFHKTLMEAPEAAEARAYLASRGFGAEVAQRWKLGFAPGRGALCRLLLDRGFTTEEIVKADLGRRSEQDGRLYDTFRGRITFPTWSLQGDVVGFGARALGDQQPKYLNTAETPVFIKSRVMYGLDRAKSSIARSHALVVEGYTDVIALHEAGVPQAVATNGVALGDTHFELLKKFSDRAVLMFDADAAGAGAAERGFDIHHRVGIEVLVAPLPPGKDPAEVVTEEGARGIEKIVAQARPLLEFKLRQTLARLPLDTPEARSRAVAAAVEVLGWQPDPIARHEYTFMAAQLIGVDAEAIQRAVAEAGGPRRPDAAAAAADRRLPGHVKVEREALRLLLSRGGDCRGWARELTEADFTAPARRELFRIALASMGGDEGQAQERLAEAVDDLSPEGRSLMTELMLADDGGELGGRVEEIFVRLKVFGLERDIKRRRKTLQEINPLEDPQRHDALFTELVGLEARRRDLLRQLQGAA